MPSAEMTYDESYYKRQYDPYRKCPERDKFRAKLVKRYVPKGQVVFELGCAYGFVLSYLEESYNAMGIDQSVHAIRVARSALRRTLLVRGEAISLLRSMRSDTSDCILAFDFLEHLRDPGSCIEEINRVMKNGGILIMCVPNLRSPMRKIKGRTWFAYRDPSHVSLLGPQPWISMIRHHGFEIIRIGCDAFWDVPYVPLVPKKLQYILLNGFQFIQTFLGRLILMPIGESLYVIAKKRQSEAKRNLVNDTSCERCRTYFDQSSGENIETKCLEH